MGVYAAQLITKVAAEGVEETKRQLGDVGKKTEEAKHHFEGLKNVLSFAGGQLLFGGLTSGFGFLKDQFGDALQQSKDAQAGMENTITVLKHTHDASGMTAEAVADLATKYSHLTMFQDDTVQSAENMLLTFTNIGKKVFPDATKTVLDMSQALGQDTKSSAIQLGKALNDPIAGISALSRVGVTFDEQQKKSIKTFMAHNDIISAQKVILTELGKEFGGQALAAGKTFDGQMAILGQTMDDIRQNIGDALMPMLADLSNKYIVPLAQRFGDWMTKGGGLKDFQNWMETASSFLQNQLIPAFSALLTKDIIPLAQWVGSLWQDAVNLFQAFQQGQGYADAIAIGIGAIGTAIALIKIEEFGAGLYNAFSELNAGAGIIANVATRALPEMGQALSWTKTQAIETSIAVEGIGAASVEAEGVVVASSAAMTLAIGAATLGISLLVGAVIAGIAASVVTGQTAMSKATQQAKDSLGQTADDIKAKQQADAEVTSVSWKASAADSTSRWQGAGRQMAQASADARAHFILDQQKMRDEAIAASQRAAEAWTRAANSFDLVGLLRSSGWNETQIAKYVGHTVTSDSGTTLTSGKHLAAHASGILDSPTGHWATVGERGPEKMFVPQGASILPHGMSPSDLGGGSSQPIILTLDGRVVARGLMPHITTNIRNNTGVRF